jgi:hypothetical protein
MVVNVSDSIERLNVAKKILSMPEDTASWSSGDWKFLHNKKAFLDVGWGQETSETARRWNLMFEDTYAIEVTQRRQENYPGCAETIVFMGRDIYIGYEPSRNDAFYALLAINLLTKPDIEIRLVRASIGNSDLNFLPLFENQWEMLRKEFGDSKVEGAFAVVPSDFPGFEKIISVPR